MEDLDKFYIGNSIDNMESKVKKLILSDSKIPKYIELLSVPSDDYNQYLLGENLRLIVKEKGLIDYNDFDKNKASTLFNHTLFENLNRIDKRSITDDLSFIENSEHKDKLLHFQKEFYSKLEIIDDFTDWYEVSNNTWLDEKSREEAKKKDEESMVIEKMV